MPTGWIYNGDFYILGTGNVYAAGSINIGNPAVVTITSTGVVTGVTSMVIVPAAPSVAFSVTGDAAGDDIQDWFENGITAYPVVSINAQGGILAGPPDTVLNAINTNLIVDNYPQSWCFNRIVTTASAAQPAISPITITITSNVLTVAGTNTLTAGQKVQFSSMTPATFLNYVTVTVLAAGLSGSSFSANFTHSDYATTADAGFIYSHGTFASFDVLAVNDPSIGTGLGLIAGAFTQAITSTSAVVSGADVFPQGPTAVSGNTVHESTGNITSPTDPWYSLVGASFSIQNFYGASVPNCATCVLDIGNTGGSHLDNAFNLFLTSNGDAGGTITNSYGIYIQRQNVASATNRFAIYEVNPQERNVLGAVDVGSRLQAIRHTPYAYISPITVIEADSPAANPDFAGQVTLLSGNTTVVYSFVNNYTGAGQPVVVVTPTSNPGAANPIWITYQGATNAWTGFTVNAGTAPGANVIFNYVVVGQV